MNKSSSWWLTSVAVVALLAFVGAGCSLGSDTAEAPSSDLEVSDASSVLPDADVVSEPAELVPGKPAAPEKTKPASAAGIAQLTQSQYVVVTTEQEDSASLHLQRPDAERDDRDTVATNALLVPDPVVSEDGSTLSYIALRNTRQDIGLVDLKSLESSLVQDGIYDGDDKDVAWNAASTRFVVGRTNGLTPSQSLLLFHFDGTGEQLLTERSEQDADVEPAFSPNGELLAFRRVSAEMAGLQDSEFIEEGSLHVYDLATGEDTLLLEHVHAFEWLDDETVLVWRTPDPRTSNEPLQLVSVRGGEPTSLVTTTSAYALSPDREEVAYVTGSVREGFDVTLFDLDKQKDGDRVSSFSDGELLPRRPSQLTFSDDGRRLGVLLTSGSSRSSSAPKQGDVALIDFGKELVRTLVEDAYAPVISPDGELMAYETAEEHEDAVQDGLPQGYSTVWVKNVSGEDEAVRLTTHEDKMSHQAGWVVR